MARILMVSSGVVGQATGKGFAKKGHNVQYVDINPETIARLRKAGLALALLYRPAVLFLDEPTIGLDVTAVQAMRRFITDYSRTTGATTMLTSHYLADVEQLCPRVLLIDHGRLAYDGELAALAATLAPYKLITLALCAKMRETDRSPSFGCKGRQGAFHD